MAREVPPNGNMRIEECTTTGILQLAIWSENKTKAPNSDGIRFTTTITGHGVTPIPLNRPNHFNHKCLFSLHACVCVVVIIFSFSFLWNRTIFFALLNLFIPAVCMWIGWSWSIWHILNYVWTLLSNILKSKTNFHRNYAEHLYKSNAISGTNSMYWSLDGNKTKSFSSVHAFHTECYNYFYALTKSRLKIFCYHNMSPAVQWHRIGHSERI